jgi:hypothetical protein
MASATQTAAANKLTMNNELVQCFFEIYGSLLDIPNPRLLFKGRPNRHVINRYLAIGGAFSKYLYLRRT